MAVDKAQFIHTVETNLKADKTYTKFFINFTKDGRRVNRVLDYSNKDWDKKTKISKAKQELMRLKEKEIENKLGFTEDSTLNKVAEVYFEIACQKSAWNIERKSLYQNYCQNDIGKKKIKDIKKLHIDALQCNLETKGFSQKTQKGCSPRTIKKILVETIKPILEYAFVNGVIPSIPVIKSPKGVKRKKYVTVASEKLILLYQAINELYHNDPYHRALFLFALFGRRWNEIRTLEWSDIDFKKGLYTIRRENNKIGENQAYKLAIQLIQALTEMKDDHVGLVFKSPITNRELHPPKRQLAKIKEKANIPELTMHYFRHILVSAMGEEGVANSILSASLGHTSLQTVNDYYLSANHTKASAEANQTIAKLLENKGKNS